MISLRQLKLLSEAVDDAESWRGSHVGAAPDWFIEEFDAKIVRMRKAVKAAAQDRDELKALKLSLEYAKS